MLTIKEAFEDYKNVVFDTTTIGLSFWSHFLDHSIDLYFDKYPEKKNDWLNKSVFSVFDINPNIGNGYSKRHEIIHEVLANELGNHKVELFEWMMNLSLLKIYNALEILILRSIQIKYFPTLNDPLLGRKEMKEITSEIKNYLKIKSVNADTNNNRYLIKYIELNSSDFTNFIKFSVRIDKKTNWEGFFEMVSILRNVVAHNNMLVTKNTLNEIKTHGKDIFEQYFDLRKTISGSTILSPKQDLGVFSNFINLFNEFGLNTVKFIFEENDLQFLGLD